ncbi:MAG: TonB-dependent receptor [Tannerella sp.]|jgi:iron complex outermembrane receptor protein|nr:TonB-dependent receptor [Tannerella sp.]
MNRKLFLQNRAYRFRQLTRKAYGAFNSMHKSITIGVLTAFTVALSHQKAVSQTIASSPQQHTVEQMQELELEEVTVTASRTETPLSQTAKIVTVITRDEIQRAPVQSIEDLLVYAASIDVVQRGGHGVQADVSIRGGSADQTAILLNGVNLSNPHTGHYSFDFPINLSDIERIEILHGPSALVFGSNAFSGGINIVTKKTVNEKVTASLEGGMYNLTGVEMRGATAMGASTNSLSASFRHSDGATDNSDYRIFNALWQTRLHPGDASRIDLLAGYNNKSYGANTFYSALYPNQYERTSEFVGAVNGLFGRGRLKFVPQISFSRHYDQFDLIKNTDTGRNYHRGDVLGANLMFRYSSPLGDTHFGGEVRREDILSSKLGKPLAQPHGHYTVYDSRTQTNGVIEHTLNLRRFTFSAGLLANYNTLQGDHLRFYPSASVAYRPAEPLKLNATWSRSSRLPTFTDLFYTTETHNANESLQPERSESFDLALAYRKGILDLSLTGYIMYGRNMIDWVREPGETKWASWNHTEVDKQGLEARATLNFQTGNHGTLNPLRWNLKLQTLSVSYSRQNQDCDTKGLESRYTLNYLRDKLTATLNHSILNNLTASWNFRYQKRMGEFRLYEGSTDMGLVPYPAFSTLDLKLQYELRHIAFNLNINNIYDTYYFDAGNVPQAGFWLIGGISYKY